MLNMNRLIVLTALLLLLFCPSLSALPPLIVTGWDSPNPAEFRQNVAEFEKWGVFDGTTIKPTRRVAGVGVVDANNGFSRESWQWSEFAEALADLRAAKRTTCRETFIMLYANPGDVDWFDDEGWREVVNHWRLLARLAKEGGLRGLLYDAEPYTKPYSQFRYSSQQGRARHSFSEYRAKARERGREVMRAVVEEFPAATIFCYRLFSDMLPLLDSGDLTRALEGNTYGLQPSFVDGWMDAVPLGLVMIEGTEDIGYRANSPAEYQAAFTRQRLRLPEFVAPENRERFARQLRIGQSLYLDAHINAPGDGWYIDRTGSSSAGRLAANLASALSASDGLVWLYGEQARWWPGGNKSSITWAQALPGAITAVRRAKDPAGFARGLFAEGKARKNLLYNGDFSEVADTNGPPKEWFIWQAENSHGLITCADGHVSMGNVLDGVVGYSVKTKPGTILALRLRVRSKGFGQGFLAIGWKTMDGNWTASPRNVHLFPTGPASPEGWLEITGLVEAPDTSGQVVFMASASSQLSAGDRCEFDDAELVEVPHDMELP